MGKSIQAAPEMPTLVDIPTVGEVEFPDSMTDDQIEKAIRFNILKQPDASKEQPSPGIEIEEPDIDLNQQGTAAIPAGQRSTISGGPPVGVASARDTVGSLLSELGVQHERASEPIFHILPQLTDDEKEFVKAFGSGKTQVLAGVADSVAQNINFFASPEGIALLGLSGAPAGLQRIAAATFGVLGLKQAKDATKALMDAQNPMDKAQAATGIVLGVGQAGLGAAGVRAPLTPEGRAGLAISRGVKETPLISPDEAAVQALTPRATDTGFVPPQQPTAVTPPEWVQVRQAPMPKRNQPPVVPETPPEPYETVLETIRNANADTIRKIQDLFPKSELSREQARLLRNQAWPGQAEARQTQETIRANERMAMQAVADQLGEAGEIEGVRPSKASRAATPASESPASAKSEWADIINPPIEQGLVGDAAAEVKRSKATIDQTTEVLMPEDEPATPKPEPVKEPNAIQERSTEALPVAEPPGDRSAVGEGIPAQAKAPAAQAPPEVKTESPSPKPSEPLTPEQTAAESDRRAAESAEQESILEPIGVARPKWFGEVPQSAKPLRLGQLNDIGLVTQLWNERQRGNPHAETLTGGTGKVLVDPKAILENTRDYPSVLKDAVEWARSHESEVPYLTPSTAEPTPPISAGKEGEQQAQAGKGMSKSQLVENILGPKPESSAGVHSRVQWEHDKKNLMLRTHNELESISRDITISRVKEGEIAESTKRIISEIQKIADEAGKQYRTVLREKADAEGIRFPTATGMTKGDIVYYISRAIAEKRRVQPPAQTPPAAAAKAQEHVAEVAKTEGARPAKEIKSELVQRLESAIESAGNESDAFEGLYLSEPKGRPKVLTSDPKDAKPLSRWLDEVRDVYPKIPNRESNLGKQFIAEALTKSNIKKITINIPGDGDFTIWNTKEALGKVLERARRLSTSTEPPKGYTERLPSREQRETHVRESRVEPPKPEPPEPISAGPGAASPGDVPPPPPPAAATIEAGAPGDRPLGTVAPHAPFFQILRQAIQGISTGLKGLAGESMPKTTAADRETGEAGVRFASSAWAARPKAMVFANETLKDTGLDKAKFGAALVEDNLRSVRERFREQASDLLSQGKADEAEAATAAADQVRSIIGSKASPFKTEDEYQDFLADPKTKEAVARHIQQWQEIVEPQYKAARRLDPDVELPTRGLQTGARINLKAIFPGEEGALVRGVEGRTISGKLTGTFRKQTPFAIPAKGTGEMYETHYPEIMANTFERQLEIANKNIFDKKLVETGNAVITKPGQKITLKGEPTVSFPLKRSPFGNQNIYVRKSLATEYESASNVYRRMKVPGLTPVANLLNKFALQSLTDFTVHTSNLLTALLNRPNSSRLLTDTLLSATGRLDAPITILKAIRKGFQDNQAQIAELAEIGATRGPDYHGILTGRILRKLDEATRLVLDDTYQQLARDGLVQRTETARREFVNSVGQYNKRLQGPMMRFLRDTGLSPFVTAGRAFGAMGVRMAALHQGLPAATKTANALLRVNAASKWIGLMGVTLPILNYLTTGSATGRPGTPLGRWDLGTKDKNGRLQSLPIADLMGLGRALRVTGIRGAVEATRLGLTPADALDAAARDIINTGAGMLAGPTVREASIAFTGEQPAYKVGRTTPVAKPGESQTALNLKEAALDAHPLVKASSELWQGKPLSEVVAKQLPRFTLQTGKAPEMIERYPQIVASAQIHAYAISLAERARKEAPETRQAWIEKQKEGLTDQQKAIVDRVLVERHVIPSQSSRPPRPPRPPR